MAMWTIRRRIIVSFGVVLALIVAVESVSLEELARIGVATDSLLNDELPSSTITGEIEVLLASDQSLTERYAAAPDSSATGTLAGDIQAANAKLSELSVRYEKTIFRTEDREAFEKYKSAVSTYLAAQQQILGNAAARGGQAHTPVDSQLAAQYEATSAALREVNAENLRAADEAAHRIGAGVTTARLGILMTFAASLLLAALCGYFLLRAITRPLGRLLNTTDIVSKGDFTQRVQLDQGDEFGVLATSFDRMLGELTVLVDQVQKSAIQVNTSVTQIGATASEQQATATEIAATTTEIGATSKEISATSKDLVSTMSEVSTVAEQTATLAGHGQAGLSRMEETMRHVTQAAASINGKLGVLNEKATNINQVVTTITKVADQTNLLSLNAAIEAEKAGEAGRGFAVVAIEIRRLADQTAVATYDIAQTVKEIQSAVAAGVMGMDKFSDEVRRGMQDVQQVGEQLSQIIHQVQTLAPRCTAVSEGMQAQATGAEQISDALTQLTEASQQTVQSLRQSNEAIGGLNQVANALRAAVSRFRLA
jgi:methyl-accepting chemotaxis protein WspA